MCGEMAADPEAIPILLGMGLDQYSVDPSNIRNVKRVIRSLRYDEAREASLDVLSMTSATEVREYSRRKFHFQEPLQ
jgi:phosphotransferase system enzyme I (PtsI)